MSGNVFGQAFRIMTFGESHGPYIGVVIDGVQPGLPISAEEIQKELDRRRPGQSAIVTPRKEADKVEIISGVFEGKTTGTPICLLIKNQDQRSKDYSRIKDVLRPGHAVYTYLKKYGVFDYRGGGRASGRETAARVAAGAVARQFLAQRGITIIGFTRQIGPIRAETVDFQVIETNAVRAPDPEAAEKMIEAIKKVRKEGDSLGGVVEIVVQNVPPGLGEPVFDRIEADLAAALMSIGAVKGVEIGEGFRAATMKGSEHNDLFYRDETTGEIRTRTNHAGGTLGGITTGEDLVIRIAVKPTSSIHKPQQTVTVNGDPIEFRTGGRHDPCICPRVVPVAEAMVALVLIDHILMQERLQQTDELETLREQINTIDTQMLLLLAQRQRLVEKIGKLKSREALPVKDPAREKFVYEQWQSVAREVGLNEEMVQKLADLILYYSRQTQENVR